MLKNFSGNNYTGTDNEKRFVIFHSKCQTKLPNITKPKTRKINKKCNSFTILTNKICDNVLIRTSYFFHI